MNVSPTALENPKIQLGLAVVAAALILGAVWLFTGDLKAVLIVLIGILLVVGLLFLYMKLVKWSRAKKAGPLERGIADNSAAAPSNVNQPARRARLDDLRKSFDSGVARFRAAGKNLYSYPWYVLVGEPGSGKTEAVRHCGVGFPPGLQDQLQGAGGTLNMNWWFTNHAIILDTAGRLMFEEVVPGSTNEWQEFLRLLQKSRPLCPINGMMLVIPADTIMTDTQDEIEHKAGRIATQLDQIQRSLGVRFPVFVVVTKCDLINGFNEFFNSLEDPAAQSQILGWSNPNGLDVPFKTEQVEQHLQVVRQRLLKYRARLLLDPVPADDPKARRLDQVDALYNLPDSIVRAGPRLKRYLEMIFVAGEWSSKPLFLRGIYFTCAMQKGAALDMDLAAALGVPASQLPAGPVWQRDRAYFLRDLFLKKVFPEKGLVTRATNASKQQRQRKLIVLGAAFAAVLLLFILTWVGASQLNERIGAHTKYWTAAREQYSADPTSFAVIKPIGDGFHYQDAEVRTSDGGTESVAFFRSQGQKLIEQTISVPLVFKPIAAMSGDLDRHRREAHAVLFEASVLYPLVSAARTKLQRETPETWGDPASAALTQLVGIEGQFAANGGRGRSGTEPPTDLSVLARYVLSPEDYNAYQAANGGGGTDSVDRALKWIYGPSGGAAWPPESLACGTPVSTGPLEKAAGTFIAYWSGQVSDRGKTIAAVMALHDALMTFKSSEDQMYQVGGRKPDRLRDYTVDYNQVSGPLAKLVAVKADADNALAALQKSLKPGRDLKSVADLYRDEVQRATTSAHNALDGLMVLIPESVRDRTDGSSRSLAGIRQRLQTEGIDRAEQWRVRAVGGPLAADLAVIDAQYMASFQGADGGVRRFEALYTAWKGCADMLAAPGSLPAPALLVGLGSDFKKIDDAVTDIGQQFDGLGHGPADRAPQVAAAGKFVLDLAARGKRYQIIDAMTRRQLGSADAWGQAVATLSGDAAAKLVEPAIPLSHMGQTAGSKFDAHYAPDAAADAVAGFRAALHIVQDDSKNAVPVVDRDDLRARLEAVQGPFEDYVSGFKSYWTHGVFNEMQAAGSSFKDYESALRAMQTWKANDALTRLADLIADALKKFGDDEDYRKVQAGAVAPGHGFQDQVDAMLARWRDVGDTAEVARARILGKKPADVLRDYFIAGASDNDGIFVQYWASVAREGMRLLAADAEDQTRKSLAELAKYSIFPLTPPGLDDRELSADELSKSRQIIQGVRGVMDASTADASAGGTVAQGANSDDRWLDDQFDRLRGVQVMGSDAAKIRAIAEHAAALPEPGRPAFSCRIVALKGSNTVDDVWPWVALVQGKNPRPVDIRAMKVANLRAAGDEDLGTVDYPGDPLTLVLVKLPAHGVDQTRRIPSDAWGAVRLLCGSHAQQDPKDPRKWQVNLVVKTLNEPDRVLQLRLEFDRPTRGYDAAP